ncbi:E3 ubiquitin-protein ligase rnf13 [Dissophora ornata]|nr:E3 ubiquitin-protein ligase rnf13 [Dissophora ornata]
MILKFSRSTPQQTAVEYAMDGEKARVLEQRAIDKSFPIRIYPSQQHLFLDKNDTLVPAAAMYDGRATDQALDKINDSPNEDGKQGEPQPANQNNALMNLTRIGRLWNRDSSHCSSSVSSPSANQTARMSTFTAAMQTTPALSSDCTIVTMQPDVQESSGSNSTQELCSICLAEYATEDRIRVLPCGHEYHVECIDIWLTNKSTQCPLCKHDLFNDTPSSSEVQADS